MSHGKETGGSHLVTCEGNRGADDEAAGGVGGGENRGVQVAGSCKYGVGVCTTMGRKPGKRLMGLLEGRVKVIGGEFNQRTITS